MNKILGNLLLLISTPVFALSTASVNQSWFYPGDQVILTISSDGNNVIFPVIKAVDRHPVLFTTNSQKIRIINNQRSRLSSQSYAFKPDKDLNIPGYTLTVDGNQQTTQPIKVTLKTPTLTKAGDDYILKIKTNKQTIFLGDEFELKVIFKEKKSLTSSQQVNIIMPEVKDLLFIKSNKSSQTTNEKYNIHTLSYKVRADNFGNFTIPSVIASIGEQNNRIFGSFSPINQTRKIQKIHSNSLVLTVNPLPDDLRVFGDFKIKANIDQLKIEQGKAANLTITITGNGNFEDIEQYKLDINDATIYSNEAEFSYNQWQQKFAIIAKENFIIPSFKLDYFDKVTQSKKHITTQPISIRVEGDELLQNPIKKIAQKSVNINHHSTANNLKYYYLLLGVVIGILSSILIVLIKNKKSNTDKNLITQIKFARNDKALFDLLLPLNIVNLETILQQLEANIYKNAQHKIRKKDVINAIKSEYKAH